MQTLIVVFLTAVVLMTSSLPSTGVEGQRITYGPNSKYTGHLVKPHGPGPFPALVVIHEWWGLNDNIKTTADKLAGEGYVALAVDMFGKVATDPGEAMRMVRSLNQTEANAKLLATTDYLRSLPYVIPGKVGSIGWCFGGGQSLSLALNDPKLVAAVMYYGKPITDPKELAKIKAAVLGIFGEADESIPIADVKAFGEALKKAGVTHEIHTYPGAGHAFANPTSSKRYNPEAAKDAWDKTIAFLQKYLKSK